MQQRQKPIAQKAEGGAKGQSDLHDITKKGIILIGQARHA